MLQGGDGGRSLGRPWNGEALLKRRLSPGPEKGLVSGDNLVSSLGGARGGLKVTIGWSAVFSKGSSGLPL